MTTRLARYCAHVLFQPVPEGGVLLDTASETYYGLNAVGARICELLPHHESLDTLCAELSAEYPSVPATELRADVAELLDALSAHGLLEHSATEHENGGTLVAPPTP